MMLFAALIKRIFGTKKSQTVFTGNDRMSGREFFNSYPRLYSFVFVKLSEIVESLNSDKGVRKVPEFDRNNVTF
jgi:hypothetical protein